MSASSASAWSSGAAAPVPSDAIELARCHLVVLSGQAKGTEYLVTGDLCRVGKARDNHVVLSDETVSRYHFEIVREPRGFLLRDLGSTNGTHLDGSEIREAYLKSLSIVTAGTVQIKVRSFSERIEPDPTGTDRFGPAVAASPVMKGLFALLKSVATTDAAVLLQGEAGTGKDLFARALHDAGPRALRPFIQVDCSSSLVALQEKLFGVEGTGDEQPSAGAFELAGPGTVYLDEVSDLPQELQSRLLRTLTAREVVSAGARPVRVDARVIASSRKDLRVEVERGRFPAELQFRLAAVAIAIPPLRERSEDVRRILEELSARGQAPAMPEAVIAALTAMPWPGNVRELALAAGPVGLAALSGPQAPGLPDSFEGGLSFRKEKQRWEEDFEQRYLRWLLARTGGNVSQASRDAQMDRKYLHKLLKKHNIDGRGDSE